MSKICRHAFLLAMILSTFFLSGCWDQKIFEETGFILQIGLEIDKNGELLHSLTMPVVEEEIEQKIEILSTTAPLLRESRDKMRKTSGKRIEGGKTQQIHFSRELAEKGVKEFLDVFIRNPANPILANVTVVEGSPLEMFQMSLGYKDKTRVAFYISDLIDDARKITATSDVRVYDFIILSHCKTIDPTAVYMRYDEKAIEILGTALFCDGKMVGNLGIVETGLLYALMGEKINFSYYYREGNNRSEQENAKSGIALSFKRAKKKVEIDTSGDIPKICISLDLKATIDEYDDEHHLDDSKNKKEIEDKVAILVKDDCKKILKYLQEIGSDPIGFAEMVRSKHNAYYKSIDWKKVYPDIEINVDVKTTIESQGAIN